MNSVTHPLVRQSNLIVYDSTCDETKRTKKKHKQKLIVCVFEYFKNKNLCVIETESPMELYQKIDKLGEGLLFLYVFICFYVVVVVFLVKSLSLLFLVSFLLFIFQTGVAFSFVTKKNKLGTYGTFIVVFLFVFSIV